MTLWEELIRKLAGLPIAPVSSCKRVGDAPATLSGLAGHAGDAGGGSLPLSGFAARWPHLNLADTILSILKDERHSFNDVEEWALHDASVALRGRDLSSLLARLHYLADFEWMKKNPLSHHVLLEEVRAALKL